jgi:predicted choloylglycine hydrolase
MFNRAIALNDGSAYFTAERNREVGRALIADTLAAKNASKTEFLRKFAENLKETEQIIEKFGDQLWPYVYSLLASGYRHQLKDYNKAWYWIDRTEAFEPCYENYAHERREVIRDMKQNKVPVPEEWLKNANYK